MSIQTLGRVFTHSQASGTAYTVLIVLANHEGDHDGESYSWPSIDRIAREARCSRRAVINALSTLEALGELVIDRNAGPNSTNIYKVQVAGGADIAPVQNEVPVLHPNRKQPSRGSSSSGRTKNRAPRGAAHDPQLAEALLAPDSRAQYLLGRLSERTDETWAEVTPAVLIRLGRKYGAGPVVDALGQCWADGRCPMAPYPYLESICIRLSEAVSA